MCSVGHSSAAGWPDERDRTPPDHSHNCPMGALAAAALFLLLAAGAEATTPLDLDALHDDAPPAAFEIPVKVNGQEVDCGFWPGQDPASVAIEFGSLHQLEGKQISRLRQALADEAAARGLLDDSRAPVARTRVDAPAATQGLAVTRLTDRWAAMQVATVRFAHRCERPLSTSSRQRLQLVILGLLRALTRCCCVEVPSAKSSARARMPWWSESLSPSPRSMRVGRRL